MIELHNEQLVFRFPDVHDDAVMRIDFQRTLRIPDDGRDYPLPAGLGRFPMRHVDDFADRLPATWKRHGGVMLPMYQSEALWINFTGNGYPFAVKVATGKVSAITGEAWKSGLHRDPQDYVVIPGQPWLDGYVVERGIIRQFVAMPLGSGYSAEEQITGEAEFGGLQIEVFPLKAQYYRPPLAAMDRGFDTGVAYSLSASFGRASAAPDMGLAPGGRMRQEIYDDHHDFDEWDTRTASRCFVHLANSLVWRGITGSQPPTAPLTVRDYKRAGIPWFDYYADGKEAVEGAGVLEKLKSIAAFGASNGEQPLPENESTKPDEVIVLGDARPEGAVREGDWG